MSTFFYCSEEVSEAGLPVACHVVRYLELEMIKAKAAVVKTRQPIFKTKESDFVILAKGNDLITDVARGGLVGVYLMPLDARAGSDELDLAGGLQPVKDWGAITMSKDQAERWQA